MNNETHLLFVYGSLRSGFHHPAYGYLSRYFNLMGGARVKGSLYDMGEYPVAIPSDNEKYITGELYTIKNPVEFDYAIGQLDDYEGIYAEAGQTALYKRETAAVLLNDQYYIAWIYWFNGNVNGFAEIASGDVLQYLQQKNKL
jgi:gamma-glutamylcyclotransferase (GGCT)/AIG2-like uncharacterized protein YtfP